MRVRPIDVPRSKPCCLREGGFVGREAYEPNRTEAAPRPSFARYPGRAPEMQLRPDQRQQSYRVLALRESR